MSTKFCALTFLILFIFNSSSFAQRAPSKSTKSLYFSIPAYDLKTNPSDLIYSFAMGNTRFKTPKQFEAEEVCVASGSKNVLKDAKKITVYQYSVSAELGDAYLIIENTSGEILYAEDFNDFGSTGTLTNESLELIYGDDECYWHPKVLEQAWEKDRDSWIKEQNKTIKSRYLNNAMEKAKGAMKGGYVAFTINVYTAKGGKGYDYSDLDKAQLQALTTYNEIYKYGKVNKSEIDKLMVPVKVWLSHLDQVDLDDKKAKINRKVAQGLYMNLAFAYYQILNYDEAAKYLELHEDAYSNAVMRGSDQNVKNLSKLITEQRKGMLVNSDLNNDYDVLNKTKMPSGIQVNLKDLGDAMVDELAGRYYFYSKDKEKEEALTASGSIYKKNISQGQYGPTLVMMTIYDGDLNEFPLEVTQLNVKGLVFSGGYSFEKIPPEIGNMTNLEQIILADSNVSSIPEEIGNLSNLKRLNLSRTKISGLPESIKNLKNLKMLNIKKTNISEVEAAKIQSWLPKCKVKF